MISIKRRMLAVMALTISLVGAAFGQQATTPAPPARVDNRGEVAAQATTPSPQASATTAPAPGGPAYVEEKGFKTKIIEVKYRDPVSLYRVVGTLGSGFKGAVINPNTDFKTLTVRDFPENIAVIEEAIKRLDTPEAQFPDIEIHIHVLIASNNAASSNERPAELTDVIKQLQTTLAYKNYSLMTSSILRAKEGRGVENSGVAESKLFNVEGSQTNPTFYVYRMEPISVDSASPGASKVQTGNFSFNMRVPLNLGTSVQYENVGFRTPVSVREGERVVVGTTTMGDKGLIVVLSARVIKP